MKLYHGLNQTFVIKDLLPTYNGIFSTSTEMSVAEKFAFDNTPGIMWTIQVYTIYNICIFMRNNEKSNFIV